MSIPEAKSLRSMTKLIRLLSERVRLLEQRSPGRDRFPAAEFLAQMGSIEQCIEALETRPQRQEAPRQLEPLRQHNASRRAEADCLKAEIAKLLDGHPRADELTARQIREALKCAEYTPLPAERTVRLHLARIRGNGNAGRDAAWMT